MFEDNKSVINSSMNSCRKIKKKHVDLSFGRVRETIVAVIVSYCFIQGSLNPADMLRKCWNRDNIGFMLQLLIFWQGDSVDLFKE